MSAHCKDCGAKYPFGVDLVLPDEQWNWIHPEGPGGLLCPTCICRRVARLKGSTCILAWVDRIDWSGPRPAAWFRGLINPGSRGIFVGMKKRKKVRKPRPY